MINFGPKAKVSKKATKKTLKALPRRRAPSKASANDLLTPEDIAEINMFGAAIAKSNWTYEKQRWAKTVAEWKKFQKGKPGA